MRLRAVPDVRLPTSPAPVLPPRSTVEFSMAINPISTLPSEGVSTRCLPPSVRSSPRSTRCSAPVPIRNDPTVMRGRAPASPAMTVLRFTASVPSTA